MSRPNPVKAAPAIPMSYIMRIIPFLLIIMLMPLESGAMEFVHKDTVLLTDINGITAGRLGRAVGVNRGAVFMAAPEQDSQAGATYEYKINNQRQLDFVRELDPQDATPRLYGSAIVTEGDVTAVSYSSDDGIELFTLNAGNWVFSKWLEPPTIAGVTVRGFGKILDVSGDFLVVGDPSAIAGGVSNAGVVMIFGRNTGGANNWGLITHFLDPDPPEKPKFASSVAIASDLMVVGDAQNERVFLYGRSGSNWSYKKELQPTSAVADDMFGVSVEAEGNFVAVGTLNGNEALSPTNSGSVHIFHRDQGGSNNFGQLTELAPSAAEFIDRFGESLRFRQELLVVGAPGAQQVYVFSHLSGLWKEEQKILPPGGLTFNNVEFGIDVDYHNGSLVVGSDRWNDIGGERYGAVFLYEDPGIVVCGALDGVFCDSFESD